MIYKLSDGTRVRAIRMNDDAGTVEFEHYRFTPKKETLSFTYLDGEDAKAYIRNLSARDSIRFAREFGGQPVERTSRSHVAHVVRALFLGAGVTVVAAVGFIVAPNPQAPAYPLLSDVPSAHVLTPGERPTSDTDRDGQRKTLAPSALPSATR